MVKYFNKKLNLITVLISITVKIKFHENVKPLKKLITIVIYLLFGYFYGYFSFLSLSY
jgi:hypothetical protein